MIEEEPIKNSFSKWSGSSVMRSQSRHTSNPGLYSHSFHVACWMITISIELYYSLRGGRLAQKGLDDQRQLRLDDEEVTGHGCRQRAECVSQWPPGSGCPLRNTNNTVFCWSSISMGSWSRRMNLDLSLSFLSLAPSPSLPQSSAPVKPSYLQYYAVLWWQQPIFFLGVRRLGDQAAHRPGSLQGAVKPLLRTQWQGCSVSCVKVLFYLTHNSSTAQQQVNRITGQTRDAC